MTEMFGEAWSPMSVPDLTPDDDDDRKFYHFLNKFKEMNSIDYPQLFRSFIFFIWKTFLE